MKNTFWPKVDIRSPDECWPWIGAKSSNGYGNVRRSSRNIGAHRLAYAYSTGRPISKWVLHHCDNRTCCNPSHLFEGTALDNQRDAISKGRSARHERHGMSRLKKRDVSAIRELDQLGWSGRDIARAFEISFAQVSLIVNHKVWVSV